MMDVDMNCGGCAKDETECECLSSRSPACFAPAHVRETATNIRRNLRQAHRLLKPGNDRDSQLIDLVNHMDALAQQIENGP